MSYSLYMHLHSLIGTQDGRAKRLGGLKVAGQFDVKRGSPQNSRNAARQLNIKLRSTAVLGMLGGLCF